MARFLTQSEIRLGNCKDILPEYYHGQFNLILTSPPYFNQRDCADYGSLNDYFDDMTYILNLCIDLAAPGAIFSINVGSDPEFDLPSWWSMQMQRYGLSYIDRIAWIKGTGNITRRFHIESKNCYYPQIVWEPIYIYQKSRGLADVEFPRFEERFKFKASKFFGTNVWQIPQDTLAEWHPAPYPLALAETIIQLYTEPGAKILDPFGGAMTTAVACQSVGGNRMYLMCEVNEEFYKRGVERVRSFTLQNSLL